ncbi:toll/interleukin-1 receptor domain-containing protein [Actinosynnema sp. NPDC059797]
MSNVFVNYRHGPHAVAVSALAHRLTTHFGPGRVFVDHHLRGGTRYPDELRDRLRECDVLVVVVHDGWVGEFGTRDPDWVLDEIAFALAEGKAVVPVLVDDARPPSREELPERIGELATRQTARLRASDLPDDLERLVRRLEQWVAPPQPDRPYAPPRAPTSWMTLAWLVFLGLVPPTVLALAAGDWLAFASSAVIALLLLVGLAVVTSLQLLALGWTTGLERRVGVLPYGQYLGKTWLVAGLGGVAVLNVAVHVLANDQRWTFAVISVVVVCAAYSIERLVRRKLDVDREWPPPPSLEPHEIRRAMVRLLEHLDTDPHRTGVPTRLHRDQARQVYLDLAEVRLFLLARRDSPWREWVGTGRCSTVVPATTLVLAVTAFAVTAVALHDGPPGAATRLRVAAAVLVLLAVAVAAAAMALSRVIARRQDRGLVDELTGWQAAAGPLVFPCPPPPGTHTDLGSLVHRGP